MAFGFKHGSKSLIKFVAKPTVTGAYTFDNSKKTATISGYDAEAMEISGTREATSSGTYTVTFTLKKGYGWTDKTKEAVSCTWSIAKRSITIPSMTNTSYTWETNKTYKPTISDVDSTYVSQSGTVSSTNAGSWTVTWALSFPNDTTWSDNTTANKTASWSVAKRKITIPSMTNTSQTWAVNTTFKPTISNLDSTYVTQSGTVSSTSVGSWTVTWALTYSTNTTWTDNATANKTATWAVNKLTLTVPSLSGTTSWSFIEGTTRSVSVSNFNSTYETQSGTTSTSALGTYTVKWALRYPANTQWSGGTTTEKSATWSIVWTNGTSHYSNDLYNKGWYKSNSLEFTEAGTGGTVTWNTDNLTIQYEKMRTAEWHQGKTIHFMAKAKTTKGSPTYPVTFYIYEYKTGSDWGRTTNTSANTLNTDQFREYSGTNTLTYERHLGTANSSAPTNSNAYATVIQRIWVT